MDTTDWRERAACKGEDTETFFPLGDESEYRAESPAAQAQAAPAKAICARCPVIDDCREWAAIETHQRFGVFGGMTARERHLYRQRRAYAAAHAS